MPSTTSPPPVGIALAGLAHAHALGKLKAVLACPDATLVGLWEPDGAVRAARLEQAGLDESSSYDGLDRLLADERVEAVVVDGPVAGNVGLAACALEAGRHVLQEKPAGLAPDDLPRLQALARAHGLVLQIGYQFRYTPAMMELREIARAGILGDVFFCRARMGKDKASYERLEQELRDFPGGTFFELGCHALDFIVGLMGAPTRASAVLRTDYGRDTPLADNTLGVFEFASGIASIESSMMEIEPFMHRRLEVFGTAGTAIVQPIGGEQLSVTLESDHAPYHQGSQDVPVGSWPMFAGDISEFAACIRERKRPDYGMGHDLAVQQALLTACGIS